MLYPAELRGLAIAKRRARTAAREGGPQGAPMMHATPGKIHRQSVPATGLARPRRAPPCAARAMPAYSISMVAWAIENLARRRRRIASFTAPARAGSATLAWSVISTFCCVSDQTWM